MGSGEEAESMRLRSGIADLSGTILTGTRGTGLPATDDPGLAPLRRQLAAGRPGFSSIMIVTGIALEAVAVPIMVSGTPAGFIIGFNEVAKTQLQAYVTKLSGGTHLTTIIDSAGRIAAIAVVMSRSTVIGPRSEGLG
jgi:hypothetical protein